MNETVQVEGDRKSPGAMGALSYSPGYYSPLPRGRTPSPGAEEEDLQGLIPDWLPLSSFWAPVPDSFWMGRWWIDSSSQSNRSDLILPLNPLVVVVPVSLFSSEEMMA